MNFRRFALVREVIVDFRLLGRRLSFWLRCLGTELLALFDEYKTWYTLFALSTYLS